MKKILPILLLLAGCLRGETKSLDQVYSIAQGELQHASRASVSTQASAPLETIEKQLTSLVGNPKVDPHQLEDVSTNLTTLLPLAGYTVRPALTELRNQYLELQGQPEVEPATVKLLASRTFSTLASELNAGSFNNG